jgi:hypothetical protein
MSENIQDISDNINISTNLSSGNDFAYEVITLFYEEK